jgi:molybdate transport system substrate-binding protein
MKFSKTLIVFLLVLLLATSACTSQATPGAATLATTAAPAPNTAPTNMTVLAAASLTESFNELGQIFESQHPGIKVAFSFAGSQQLSEQLNQGADADVFASASKKYMDAAVAANRVTQDAPEIFAQNRLVVVYPKDNPAGLQSLKDLANPGLKLVLADKTVPVGQYSLEFLDKASLDPAFGAVFKDAVLANIVSFEENVKSVLGKVQLGEADAGIVYVTDITQSASEQVDKIVIPDALNTIANYPIAPISDSKNADLARAFVALIMSPGGQAVLAKYGFLPAPAKK